MKKIFITAEIGINHNGDLGIAKGLIDVAVDAGADAVKFQHHDVSKYVSDEGFKNLGDKFSHQSKWEMSTFKKGNTS